MIIEDKMGWTHGRVDNHERLLEVNRAVANVVRHFGVIA